MKEVSASEGQTRFKEGELVTIDKVTDNNTTVNISTWVKLVFNEFLVNRVSPCP